MAGGEGADDRAAGRLAAIQHAQGSIAHLAPDRDLADELVRDRRAESPAETGKLRSGLPGSVKGPRERIKAAIKANRETLRRLAK
jgi:hypothetical protein